MAERLIEVVVPGAGAQHATEVLGEHPIVGSWMDMKGERLLLRALIPAEATEGILDQLQKRFTGQEGFHILVLAVEAAIPRPAAATVETVDTPEEPKTRYRVSREELYAEAADSIRGSPVFIALTVLSAVVASVGLLRNDLAIVIGAMMIAPLLAPNVALALGTALGDLRLVSDAMRTNLLGVSIALLFSVVVGLTFTVDPTVPAIGIRTVVSWADILLALAAGAAGALAFSSGLPSAVIGVMVAVALLPPLVNFGLLLGGGHFVPASGAFLLLAINVVCVNLAGVIVFLAQGVRPLTLPEAERARRASRIAMILWASLLALLAVLLVLSQSLSAGP